MLNFKDLQERIKILFDDARVQKYEAVFEKDKNGWNWILTFHKLTNENTLIIHTKFIFKLDESKDKLRANEFLYLYDLNCKYKVVRFSDFSDMDTKIRRIILQNQFGKNIMSISEFMISPAKTINNYFYQNKVDGYSIYDFNYTPDVVVVPCQKLELYFKFNLNNKQDVSLTIKKIKEEKFKLTFSFGDISDSMDVENLDNLAGAVTQFIKRNIEK